MSGPATILGLYWVSEARSDASGAYFEWPGGNFGPIPGVQGPFTFGPIQEGPGPVYIWAYPGGSSARSRVVGVHSDPIQGRSGPDLGLSRGVRSPIWAYPGGSAKTGIPLGKGFIPKYSLKCPACNMLRAHRVDSPYNIDYGTCEHLLALPLQTIALLAP